VAEQPSLTPVPIGAAEVLAELSRRQVAFYLPSDGGHSPILYREEEATELKPDFSKLRASGISAILVRGDDLGRCEQVLEDHLSRVLRDPRVSSQQKAACVQQVGTSVVRDLIDDPAAPRAVERASTILDHVIESVLSQPGVASTLLHMSAHHQNTASHMFAVSALAVLLGAEVLGPDEDSLKAIGLAGMLHDMGKLHISPEILNKPSALTADELRLVQHHPIESVRLLGDCKEATSHVRQMILQHHERFDGQGYPLGIAGDEMLLGSRILAIVDSFHAMIGRRLYKRPMTPAEAVRVMKLQQGRQFDPKLYAQWVRLFNRCWQSRADAHSPPVIQPVETEQFHRDHRVERPAPVQRGQPRLPCNGRVQVQCCHAGRLGGTSSAPDRFVLPLLDLSKAGMCLRSMQPMYRGEVLHLFMEAAGCKAWVRGLVAWCRRAGGNEGYKVGVRFLEKISPDRMNTAVPVPSIHDSALLPTTSHSPAESMSQEPRGTS